MGSQSSSSRKTVLNFLGSSFRLYAAISELKKLETTSYHLKTNGKTESYNKTIFSRMFNYVYEHQSYWDTYIQLLTCAYNNQMHHSTGIKPFELVLSRVPPDPTMRILPTAFPTDRTTDIATGKLRQVFLRRLAPMTTKIGIKLSKAQQRYKR